MTNNTSQKSGNATSSPTPRATLGPDGLHFHDPAITGAYKNTEDGTQTKNYKSIANVNLSPSLISGVLNCPAQAMANKYILQDITPVDPLAPNELGSAFHKVMEIFFKDKPEDRTNAGVVSAYDQTMELADFQPIGANAQARAIVQDWVRKLWMSGKLDWQHIRVASLSDPKKGEITGLECFVKGNLAGATRATLGFIDLLARADQNGENPRAVGLVDWKTGKKPHVYNPYDRFPDFDYTRQQTLYALLLEQQGYDVKYAQLVYPAVEGVYVQDVPIHDTHVRQKSLDDVSRASDICDEGVATNTWKYGSGALCSWCPLVNICPAANKRAGAKFEQAREGQWKSEELTGQIERDD